MGCHTNRDPHRTLFGRDYQGCHDVDAWTIAALRHPSPRSQDCVQCHQAPPNHYMMHFEMMDRTISGQGQARVEQCYLCHQTDAWNNIRGVGWRKMHGSDGPHSGAVSVGGELGAGARLAERT